MQTVEILIDQINETLHGRCGAFCYLGHEEIGRNAEECRFVWVPKERRRKFETQETGGNPRITHTNGEHFHVYCYGATLKDVLAMDSAITTALEDSQLGVAYTQEDALHTDHEDGHRGYLLICPVTLWWPNPVVTWPSVATEGSPADLIVEKILDEVQPEQANTADLIPDTAGNIDAQD